MAGVVGHEFDEVIFNYTERDVALYALGIGAASSGRCTNPAGPGIGSNGTVIVEDSGTEELDFVAPLCVSLDFRVLPTFAVLFPGSIVDQVLSLDALRFDPEKLLHGEHYVELFTNSLPTRARVASRSRINGLKDKGRSALLEVDTVSRDADTGQLLALNRAVCVLRGAGGFASKQQQQEGAAQEQTRSTQTGSWQGVPQPQPLPLHGDATTLRHEHGGPHATYEQRISPTQALVYRLSGDYNPLHADPAFAAAAGFPKPILHGLCTLGYAVRALLILLGHSSGGSGSRGSTLTEAEVTAVAVQRLRCRFLSHVFPGETLVTHVWFPPVVAPSSEAGNAPHAAPSRRAFLQCAVRERDASRLVLTATVDLRASAPSAWHHMASATSTGVRASQGRTPSRL